MKEKYKKKKYTKSEMRKLYEEDPAMWLLIYSKGKHGKSKKEAAKNE